MFLLVAHQDCTDSYLNRVLESQNYAHYFLVLKVKTESGEKEIVVLNHNLHNMLMSRDSSYADIMYYRDFIKAKIKKSEALNVTEKDLVSMQATIVKKNQNIEKAAEKGKNYFMSRYFDVYVKHNYARHKYNISSLNNTAIVKQLFNWNYFIEINESNIEVPELNFCDASFRKQ
jgi:hypothetical protein